MNAINVLEDFKMLPEQKEERSDFTKIALKFHFLQRQKDGLSKDFTK